MGQGENLREKKSDEIFAILGQMYNSVGYKRKETPFGKIME